MEHSRDQEIDLGQLLLGVVKVINKNKLLLTIMIVLGGIFGTLYYYIAPSVYESSMMLRSDILTEAYSTALTGNLKKLIDGHDDDVLAEKLNLSKEQASHLLDIKVEGIETPSLSDMTENLIFLISVEISDNSILPDLENGIKQYLENNEYVKKRIELRKEKFLTLTRRVRKDISELDSLKKDFLNGSVYNQQLKSNVIFLDPTEIYAKMMILYKEEISYLQSLELNDSIQLIEGFTVFSKAIAPKRIKSIMIGMAIGLVIALLIMLLREVGIYLKQLDEQSIQ